MASNDNSYKIQLKETHLNWGEYRNPTNRELVSGEAYIPIPRNFAKKLSIFNSNFEKQGYGYNLFHANSSDGYLKEVTLLAQGSSKAADIYAKQFSVKNDLKAIGSWYKHCGVVPGDYVRVTFLSHDTIYLEILK